MGIYPNCELSQEYLEGPTNTLGYEINQGKPRFMKNNLLFYKIRSVHAGYLNSAVVTDAGHIFLHGSNELGQLCLGEKFGKIVPFFPEFRQIDYFKEEKVSVIDVALGFSSGHVLAEDNETKKKRVFGFGNSEKGQVGHGGILT